MANVGRNIRLLRKERGMTQDALAELLYVSRQTVSNYENGKSNPDIDMLVKIAEVLETDVNILIFGIPVSPSKKKAYIKLLCAVLIFLLLAFLYLQLKHLAEEWRREKFDNGPIFVLHMILRPAVYLVCGWMLMQAVSIVWGIKRQNQRGLLIVRNAVIGLLCLYLLLTVPFCAERLMMSGCLLRSVDLSGFPQYLPDLWHYVAIGLWSSLSPYPLLFLLAGLVLWNGGEKKQEKP